MSIQNTLKVILWLQQLLIMSPKTWPSTKKRFLALFWFALALTLSKKPLTLSTKMHGEMELLFSHVQALLLTSSKMKSNAVKLVSMFPFPCPYPCFHSQEAKNLSTEIWTSTAKLVWNSSLNGRQLLADGKKRANSQNYRPHSPPINDP